MTSNQSISVTEDTIIESRMEEIGDGELPSTFAIVPQKAELEGGEAKYYHKVDGKTLRKLFEEEGLSESRIEDESLATLEERDVFFLGPVIFFSYEFIVNNWAVIVTIISVVQTYAKDKTAGEGQETTGKTQLDIEYETPEGGTRSVDFEGDPENLPEILEAIKSDYGESEIDESDLETANEPDE